METPGFIGTIMKVSKTEVFNLARKANNSKNNIMLRHKL